MSANPSLPLHPSPNTLPSATSSLFSLSNIWLFLKFYWAMLVWASLTLNCLPNQVGKSSWPLLTEMGVITPLTLPHFASTPSSLPCFSPSHSSPWHLAYILGLFSASHTQIGIPMTRVPKTWHTLDAQLMFVKGSEWKLRECLSRWLVVKNPPASSGDMDLIRGFGKIPWRRK